LFPSLLIFYLLVLYIFTTLVWWSYLLIKRNNQIYQYQKEIYLTQNPTADDTVKSALLTSIENERKRQNNFIYIEASLFIILLIYGTIRINDSFRKEIALNRQQKNFLLSITHELKSPLAGIKISLETIKNRVLSDNQKNLMLSNALADTERLGNLINNLLFAAQLETQSFMLGNQKLNFSTIVSTLANAFERSFKNKRFFNIKVRENIFINGDNTALNSIVSNLIENAVKYSDDKSKIDVILQWNDNKKVELIISDNGIGISKDNKSKIFEKFYRVGSEQTRKTKGTGLGLFIIKQLVAKHKAKIEVFDNVPKGTVFKIEFNPAN